VTWQIFVRAAAESDLESLSGDDQQNLTSEIFAWVDHGPPRQTPRDVLGVTMFDDTVAGAFRVTYVVDSEHERVFVVRIRKALHSG
jgi:mRNA-degrading endonuclease RelE of RelBE toxin-antitoxin system